MSIPPCLRLVCCVLLCSPWFCGASRADLDAEANNPYQVRVVLSVAEHRMLTSAFKLHLENDLKAQLELAFGKLAKVDIVRAHPLLNDIRTRGLQPVLDAWDELSQRQTVFVLLDFVDGRYVIEMGQHDGLTGLSSPVVRQRTLSNGQRVAATAAQMIHADFALVGTVGEVTARSVQVVLKGGALNEMLSTWVQRGDVFAVARITQEGDKLRATRVDWAILQAISDPRDGAVMCKYFHRYQEDQLLFEPPTLGYRCVKLNTTRGPVRLRLVNDKTQEFLNGLVIHASPDDAFGGKTQDASIDGGFFKSSQSFDKVAYVRVLSSPPVHFPVPIIDDRVVVVRINPNAKGLAQGQVEQRRDRWVRWLYEALGVAAQSFQELNAVVAPDNLDKALALADKSHKALADEVDRLHKEHAKLLDLARTEAPGLDLSEGNQLLKALGQKKEQLEQFLKKLANVIQEKGSKETLDLQAKLQQAELLERQADFEKAIQLYEAVLKVRGSAEVQQRLNQLKEAWKVKDARHAQARDFIYAKWPTLDLAGLTADIGKAKEMFQRCQAAGDTKTPQKLVQVNVQHASALAKRMEVLKRAPDTEDNRLELKALVQLAGNLRALQNEVTAWVAKDKK